MRIVMFANNRVGWEITCWLKQQGEEIVGLVLHDERIRSYSDEIVSASGLTECNVFEGSRLNELEIQESIRNLHPDIGLSVYFGYIFRHEVLGIFPKGIINLHPSYLPYGRGAYPNVWSIVDDTPAGATLHYIDAGIDTGDIISQRKVNIEPVDTGETLYRKLEDVSTELFRDSWELISSGSTRRKPQSHGDHVTHRIRDVEKIDCINLDQVYKARDLINILRARTFSPNPGAFFRQEGRKIYMQLELLYENELDIQGRE